ncbi:helix-turn-helix transcriptional regulator [Nocardia bovistercoris]|uniref:helix-turn-helix transcriptional regulator n=1 Tax=Nocardia bovistercoris TaxID=2785916 RepID=UPI002FCCF389
MCHDCPTQRKSVQNERDGRHKDVEAQPHTDTWLTRNELAERLKLPPRTLAAWATRGKGPRGVQIGRHTRYWLPDVIEWENAQRQNSRHAA